MTEQLATIPTGATLKSGWKYLFTSWSIVVAMVAAVMVLGQLFPQTGTAPKMPIGFFEPAWLNGLASLIVGGLVMAIPGAFLLAAIVMAIKSMLKKQGGIALLATSIFGSYAAFIVGTFLLWLIGAWLSGNTH